MSVPCSHTGPCRLLTRRHCRLVDTERSVGGWRDGGKSAAPRSVRTEDAGSRPSRWVPSRLSEIVCPDDALYMNLCAAPRARQLKRRRALADDDSDAPPLAAGCARRARADARARSTRCCLSRWRASTSHDVGAAAHSAARALAVACSHADDHGSAAAAALSSACRRRARRRVDARGVDRLARSPMDTFSD